MIRRSRWLLLGAVVIAGGAGLYAMEHRPDAPAPTAAGATQPIGVGALGRVEPASRVRKLSQPGGFSVNRVARLEVEEGTP